MKTHLTLLDEAGNDWLVQAALNFLEGED